MGTEDLGPGRCQADRWLSELVEVLGTSYDEELQTYYPMLGRGEKDMDEHGRASTDMEVAEHIRNWVRSEAETPHDYFSWATDGCCYEQHIRFVRHRNANWTGDPDDPWEFNQFLLDYADLLEAGKIPAYEGQAS